MHLFFKLFLLSIVFCPIQHVMAVPDSVSGREEKQREVFFAVFEDNVEEMKRILSEDRDAVNTKVERIMDGAAALHYSRSIEMVQLLLDHGADVNATDARGRTPLFYITLKLQLKTTSVPEDNRILRMIQLLLDRGADVNVPVEANGETILYKRIKNRRHLHDREMDFVFFLLKNGGRVNKGEALLAQSRDVIHTVENIYKTYAELSLDDLKAIKQWVKSEVPNNLSEDVLQVLDTRITEERQKSSGGSGGSCSKGFKST